MRAFTLIETLLYIALFSLMLTGMVSSAFVLHDSASRTRAAASALQEELLQGDGAL